MKEGCCLIHSYSADERSNVVKGCVSRCFNHANLVRVLWANKVHLNTQGMPPSECVEDDPRLGAGRNEGDGDDDGGRRRTAGTGAGERNIIQGCVGEIHQRRRSGGGKHNTAQYDAALHSV